MSLEINVRKYGRGYWLYLPKTLYDLMGGPESFEVTVADNQLVLTPKKR